MDGEPVKSAGHFLGPPLESATAEPLMTKPIPLAVIDKYFDRCPPPVAKDEYRAGKGIGLQNAPANLAEPINAFAEVGRFGRDKYAHLRGELNHGHLAQKFLLNAKKSRLTPPAKCIRIFSPCLFSISIRHSDDGEGWWAGSSRKQACCAVARHFS
jgi:hypothetical protein